MTFPELDSRQPASKADLRCKESGTMVMAQMAVKQRRVLSPIATSWKSTSIR